MRIGIDCRSMLNPAGGERAGVGHYTYHLVKALLALDRQNEYILYVDHRMPMAVTDELLQPNASIRRVPFSRYRKLLPFAYSHVLLAAYLTRDKLDVFHAPANVMPLSYARPTVVTIHDLAIYEHPEWFPTQIASTRLLVPRTIKRAKAIITVSEATKKDLLDLFNVTPKKVTVVPEAADTALLHLRDESADVRAIYKLPKKFVLYVGTIDPRKNLMVLVQAWQMLLKHDPAATEDTALVIAGGPGYRGKHIVKSLEALELPSVKVVGYVPHNHKVKLMSEAAAFVYPTWYEGFGLPVLEAMQLGTPVITSDVSSIPEVAGQAALLGAPDDVETLAANIKKVLSDSMLAKKLSQAGIEQAQLFSWERAAKETLEVYKKAAGLDPHTNRR